MKAIDILLANSPKLAKLVQQTILEETTILKNENINVQTIIDVLKNDETVSENMYNE